MKDFIDVCDVREHTPLWLLLVFAEMHAFGCLNLSAMQLLPVHHLILYPCGPLVSLSRSPILVLYYLINIISPRHFSPTQVLHWFSLC